MLDVASQLEAVTVYREGALCTRRAHVPSVPGGELTRVRLVGLPLSLAPGSLRARAEAPAAARVRVLDVRAGFEAALSQPADEPEELTRLEAARRALAALELELELVTRETEELEALGPRFAEPAQGAHPREAPVVALLELEAFVDAQLAARLERRRRLTAEIADARAEVELRSRRVTEAGSALDLERVKLRRCAVVSVAAPDGAAFDLCLEYQVPGARWAPSYQLRLDPSLSQGALRMLASVAQATGEDWNGVRLALSTASLLRRTDTPQLRALRIGRSQPPPPAAGWREPPQGLDELFADYDEALAAHRALGGRAGEITPDAAPTPPSGGSVGGTGSDTGPGGAVQLDLEAERAQGLEEEVEPKAEFAERSVELAAPELEDGDEAPPPRSTGAAFGARLRAPQAPVAISMPAGSRAARASARGGEGALPRGKMELEGADGFERRASHKTGGVADPLEYALTPAEAKSLAAGPDIPRQLAPGLASGLPSDELLDYAELTLGGLDQADARGRLRRPALSAVALVSTKVSATVSVEVVAALAATAADGASARARLVEWAPLPPGHAAAKPLDSFDYRYDCEHPVDVPSTGSWCTVRVMGCEVGLASELVCVPAVDPHVYRTIRVHNRSPHALLPGPVDVSTGERFLLTASLPAVAPGSADLRVGLGVEEGMKVARNTRFAETAGGFLGGSSVLQHTVTVELDNRLGAPATVEVRERVPVPAPDERDVKIEETSVSPAWEAVTVPVDGEVVPGLRRWRVEVPPNGHSSLEAQFVIRIPADKMLAGGNRRV